MIILNKGDIYNNWTVLKEVKSATKHRYFLCECSCDLKTRKNVSFSNLRTGASKSCGCLQKEAASKANTTHNMSKHPLYGVYRGMLKRCNNPKEKCYPRYGGRGIKVCKAWSGNGGFESFLAWNASLPKSKQYKSSLEIDRANSKGNYEPNNCRWVNLVEQANNKGNNVIVRFNGDDYTFKQFYNKFCKIKEDLCYNTALGRYRYGWSLEDTIGRRKLNAI